METLFTTTKKDLRQLFDELQEETIQECCSSQVYYRGLKYFDNDLVVSAAFNDDNSVLTAKVKGSRTYQVEVFLKKQQLEATCSCNQDTVCKHIVAALLYAINEDIEVVKVAKGNFDLRVYLESQPKEALVELLVQYAPDELSTLIRNKRLSGNDAQKILNKAKRDLDVIFDDEALCNDPDAFEQSLMKVLGRLSGLEVTMPENLRELIVDIINRIESATDEGYMYDHYNDYNYEPSQEFYEFIVRIARNMDFNEKTEFIEELESEISNSSYTTFDDTYQWFGKFYTDRDLPQLKTLLVNEHKNLTEALLESYYSRVSSILSANEKEMILPVLAAHNSTRAVELAELLDSIGKRNKSISMLKRLLSREPDVFVDERLCILYLEQLKAEKLEMRDAVTRCMNICPTEIMLRKASELVPKESAACEQILEKRRPEELLKYLESTHRYTDALSLVKKNKDISSERKFTFYKKCKEKFPDEAGKYFRQVINKSLENTGSHSYHTIADALKHLKKVDKVSADELVLHLRQHYKRRSNLMAMISDM